MRGLSSTTGKALEDRAHLEQSIRDILTTPIGSRVMRREYGSRLFELVDRPLSPALRIDIVMATAVALHRWEPRIRLTRVDVTEVLEKGHLALDIEGIYRPDTQALKLDGIIV